MHAIWWVFHCCGVSCLAVTFVIAGFFVATPNAIAYEELLLGAGFRGFRVLFTESSAPAWLDALGTLIPIQAPRKGSAWANAYELIR